MELFVKTIFCLFTIAMINYIRTMGRYDTHKIRNLAYIYMSIAAILAVQV